MNKFILSISIAFIFSFYSIFSQTINNNTITTIAFGSCNLAKKPQAYFKSVLKNKPDLWIWLGDIVYANTEDANITRQKYDKVKNHKNYQSVLKSCKVIGVYDDHDFGENNIGKEYKEKHESQQAVLDFLDEPANSERRKQEGVYWSYTFGSGKTQIKIILLDLRYFREMPSDTSDMLGDSQWKWLEKELATSTATINIIGSSVQFISNQQFFERWGAFPKAKQRLINLLEKYPSKNTFIISGDRHMAEISKETDLKLNYTLFDFTSSGLTHFAPYTHKDKNPYRFGKEFIWKRNFGILTFNWKDQSMIMTIKKHNNKTLQTTKLSLVNFNEIPKAK